MAAAPWDPVRVDTWDRPSSSRWIDRWLAACEDLAELQRSNPMTDAVIDEIEGRRIRIGDRWLVDFASCNYLGFDLERSIMNRVPEYLEKWGRTRAGRGSSAARCSTSRSSGG